MPDVPAVRPSTREIGDSTASYIFNKNDYNYKLTGTRGVEVYDQMRKGDATVRASLLAVMLPITSAHWKISIADSSRASKRIATFVEDQLFGNPDQTWQQRLEEALLYLVYGRYLYEKVYEFAETGDYEGMLILKKLGTRHPGTITEYKMKDGGEGVTQTTESGVYSIPAWKLMHFVHQREGNNPEGVSILRSAYKHWYIKEKEYVFNTIKAERQSIGIPIAIAPAGATPTEKDEVKEILRNMRANAQAYAVLPNGWKLEWLDMKASSTQNNMEDIQHHDRAIMLNVLAQFLQLGASGGVGSYALSDNHSRLFLLSLTSIANYIREQFNKLIKELVDFNFADVKEYPQLEVEKIGNVDYAGIINALSVAIDSGLMTKDDKIEAILRDYMDLPEFEGEEIDLAMADEMTADLTTEMNSLLFDNGKGDEAESIEEEDEDEVDPETAAENIANLLLGGSSVDSIVGFYGSAVKPFLGGPAGVPLSEETKKKISEALSKGKGKKAKGKKAKNPEITKRQEQISKLQKEVKDFSDSVRRQLLEMKANGKKMTDSDRAKFELENFDKKKKISDKIGTLKAEISSIKSAPAKSASDLPSLKKTLVNINRAIKQNYATSA